MYGRVVHSGSVPASHHGVTLCLCLVYSCGLQLQTTFCVLSSARKTHVPGLNHSNASGAGGYQDQFTASWGGEVVQSDDGKWHMYAASFGHNAGLGSWLSNSRVVHAVAAAPRGPYELADVALGPRAGAWDGLTQHNPARLTPRAPHFAV